MLQKIDLFVLSSSFLFLSPPLSLSTSPRCLFITFIPRSFNIFLFSPSIPVCILAIVIQSAKAPTILCTGKRTKTHSIYQLMNCSIGCFMAIWQSIRVNRKKWRKLDRFGCVNLHKRLNSERNTMKMRTKIRSIYVIFPSRGKNSRATRFDNP